MGEDETRYIHDDQNIKDSVQFGGIAREKNRIGFAMMSPVAKMTAPPWISRSLPIPIWWSTRDKAGCQPHRVAEYSVVLFQIVNHSFLNMKDMHLYMVEIGYSKNLHTSAASVQIFELSVPTRAYPLYTL
jgi:hypothetical protein